MSRDALATAREKFPHGKGAGGGGGTRLGAGCGQEGTGRRLGAVRLEAQRRPPVGAGAAARGAGKGGGAAVPAGCWRGGWRSSRQSFAPFASLSFAGCPAAGLLGPARYRRPVTGGCRGSPSLPLEPAPLLCLGDRGLFVPDPRRAASHSETRAAGAGSAVRSGDKATSQDPLGKGAAPGPVLAGLQSLVSGVRVAGL